MTLSAHNKDALNSFKNGTISKIILPEREEILLFPSAGFGNPPGATEDCRT